MSSFNETVDLQSFQAAVGSVGTSAAQLATVLSGKPAYKGVTIKNTHASNNLFVGKSDVTATTGFELGPDESIELVIKQPSELYVIASGASTTYTWLAY